MGVRACVLVGGFDFVLTETLGRLCLSSPCMWAFSKLAIDIINRQISRYILYRTLALINAVTLLSVCALSTALGDGDPQVPQGLHHLLPCLERRDDLPVLQQPAAGPKKTD